MSESATPSVSASGASPFRRFRVPIVIAALLALYALAGFVLAPWIVKRQVPEIARAELGREAAVERVDVNPFALSLRVQGFRLKDKDGSLLAGLDELFVNFEAESLFRRAFTFSELRLGGPYLNVVRDKAGDVNLLQLVPPAARQPEEPGGLPRLIVKKFRLTGGVLEVTDQVPAEAFRTRVGPLGVELDELSTLPDATGRHSIAITLESGTRVTIAGDVVVNPLRASGQFSLKGPFLGTVQRYLRDQLNFRVAGGESDITARFQVTGKPGGGIDAVVSDFNLGVTGVQLTADAAPDFLRWSEFRVAGGEIHWPANEATVKSVTLKGLQVKGRMEANGDVDLVALLTPRSSAGGQGGPVDKGRTAESAPATAAEPAGEPAWKVRVGEAALEDMAVEFTDASPSTPAVISVADLDLKLRDLTNEPGARFPLELAVALGGGGSLKARGTVVAQPEFALDADVQAEGIRLASAQPYVSDVARIDIRDGAIGFDGHLTSDPKEELAFDGDVRVNRLDTRDLVKNENLLAWDELSLDDLQFLLTGNRVKITRVRLVKPFGRIFIARDQTTNVGALLVEEKPGTGVASTAPPAEPAVAGQPFRMRIGKVLVSKGEVDFTDLSLPLPFAARIQDMKGEFTTIDTRSAAPSRIQLEGRVDQYGLARVGGEVRVSSPTDLADIGVLFRNIEMAPLSPYTVKFAGRKIARGKISLDLRYQLKDRRMVGSNKIVIDELELGEKVPNPEAIDLPLGLAVALLKDSNGRIDIDMPVSGSLDDPEFGVGSVLWKAFVNLITKIATSPFRLLGSLIGIESEDLGKIEFSAGRADLQPPEKEKLLRIAEALAKRPQLGVEIPPVVDPQADAAVLRTLKMEALVEQGIAASGKAESGRGLEKRIRKVVEEIYERRFPGQPLDAVQAKFQVPPPEDPQGKPRLDELAYLDDLRNEIASSQPVGDEELGALGATRAASISTELTSAGQVAAARVKIGARKDVKARDGEWVQAEIGVGGASD